MLSPAFNGLSWQESTLASNTLPLTASLSCRPTQRSKRIPFSRRIKSSPERDCNSWRNKSKAKTRRRDRASRETQRKRRLPLSGSRRVFWCDARQDAVCSLLNVLQALQKQLRVSSIEADIVLRSSPSFKSNG